MADQGKWFKLWCSALTDASLANLPNEDWARWAKLGAYIKQHGTDGKLIIEAPAATLQYLFQVTSFEAVLSAIKRLPNCKLGERGTHVSYGTNTTVSMDVEYLNWHKYQDDLSSTRVRNFRARKRQHETIQEEKRSRREERRREDISPLPQNSFSLVLGKFPNKSGSKRARASFTASVKTMADFLDIQRALENYLKSRRVRDGFIQNASTWFNNWRDWITYEEKPHAHTNNAGGAYIGAEAPAGKYASITANRDDAEANPNGG